MVALRQNIKLFPEINKSDATSGYYLYNAKMGMCCSGKKKEIGKPRAHFERPSTLVQRSQFSLHMTNPNKRQTEMRKKKKPSSHQSLCIFVYKHRRRSIVPKMCVTKLQHQDKRYTHSNLFDPLIPIENPFFYVQQQHDHHIRTQKEPSTEKLLPFESK